MNTLLHLKWITNKNLLYSTWNSAQCYVPAWMGGEFVGEWMHGWASLVAQLVKNPPAMWETWIWSLGWEDPLEKGKAPVFWPGEFHALYSPWGSKESDTAECVCVWVPLLFTRNYHNIVNWLYHNTKCFWCLFFLKTPVRPQFSSLYLHAAPKCCQIQQIKILEVN